MGRASVVGAITILAVLLSGNAPGTVAGSVYQPMTPDRVREAIAWGKSLAHTKANDPFEAYYLGGLDRLTVSTPFLRVAAAARRAQGRDQEFTERDVTSAMVKPVLEVHARAHLLGPNIFQGHTVEYTEAVNVERVYIQDHRGVRIEPLVTRPVRDQYKDEVSGVVEYRGLTAEFPLTALAPGNTIRVDLALERRIPIAATVFDALR